MPRPKKSTTPPRDSTAKTPKPARQRVYARQRATSKDRVLSQWRKVDLRDEEERNRDTEMPASQILPGVLSRLKLDQRSKETEVMKVWNHLIDARIAEHAQPAGIVRSTLFVKVDSSVWLDEIVRYRRKEILHRLQTAFGKDLIQRISFRVG